VEEISQYKIRILEDSVLPISIYRYKYMSDTDLLWTVFMFQVSYVQTVNACQASHEIHCGFHTVQQDTRVAIT